MEKRILIAEDEMIIAFNLKMMVQKNGYDVCHISLSGKDMIDSSLELRPDLLIVDIFLDDEIDGIDAVMEIHKKEDIPVIYTTASSDPKMYRKAQKTTMAAYLKKPYNNALVLKTIRSILPR